MRLLSKLTDYSYDIANSRFADYVHSIAGYLTASDVKEYNKKVDEIVGDRRIYDLLYNSSRLSVAMDYFVTLALRWSPIIILGEGMNAFGQYVTEHKGDILSSVVLLESLASLYMMDYAGRRFRERKLERLRRDFEKDSTIVTK